MHDRLRVGEQVIISGPCGTFADDDSTSTAPALFLAAGSGLAPIRSLLEAALAADARQALALVFSPGFVRACAAAADKLGVPRARVHTEVFFIEPQPRSGAAPQAKEQG